jgi:hypothetical protein
VIEMPEALGLEFESPTGDALRFEWRPDAFAALDASAPSDEPVWTLGGELDWDEIDSLRVLTARLGDGRLLAVVALRPAGAEGHGDDLVAAAIGDGESFAGVDEPLLSTEYDAEGRPRRLGLELYPGEDGLALRIAADVAAVTSSATGGAARVAAALTVRSPAGAGAGAFDLLTRA